MGVVSLARSLSIGLGSCSAKSGNATSAPLGTTSSPETCRGVYPMRRENKEEKEKHSEPREHPPSSNIARLACAVVPKKMASARAVPGRLRGNLSGAENETYGRAKAADKS